MTASLHPVVVAMVLPQTVCRFCGVDLGFVPANRHKRARTAHLLVCQPVPFVGREARRGESRMQREVRRARARQRRRVQICNEKGKVH